MRQTDEQTQHLVMEFVAQAAAYQMTEDRVERIVRTALQRQRGLLLLMEDVHNPHNLQAIARSCDAFGVQDVAFTMENDELFDPQTIGTVAASGAAKWLHYRYFEEGTHKAVKTLQGEGYHVIATWVNEKARSIYEIDFTAYDKLALMVGNEHAGISPAAIQSVDSYLYIPMAGFTRSFNVSVAAAMTLFEITRQRLASPHDFSLDEEAARALIVDLLERR